MVSVLLSETPLPSSHRWVREPLKRVAGWFFTPAVRRAKALGASLEFLPEAELPADLTWAESAPNVAGAFAGFAAVVDRAGRDLLPAKVRTCVREQVEAWDGADPGLGRGWADLALSGLDGTSKVAGRLVLLTAIAPYQVDERIVQAFVAHFPGDDKLLNALAWGSLTAARRIGTWLHAPGKAA